MEYYDLALAYVWEYDTDFIALVEKKFQDAGLSTFVISEHNIDEVLDQVIKRKLHFHYYLDRAWDVDERYENLEEFSPGVKAPSLILTKMFSMQLIKPACTLSLLRQDCMFPIP